MFRFEDPIYLWLLVLIPVLALIRFVTCRSQKKKLRKFGDLKLLKELMDALFRVAQMPTASSPSTRPDVRFIYVMGFTVVFRYNTKKLTLLSIRSSLQKPLTLYQKA